MSLRLASCRCKHERFGTGTRASRRPRTAALQSSCRHLSLIWIRRLLQHAITVGWNRFSGYLAQRTLWNIAITPGEPQEYFIGEEFGELDLADWYNWQSEWADEFQKLVETSADTRLLELPSERYILNLFFGRWSNTYRMAWDHLWRGWRSPYRQIIWMFTMQSDSQAIDSIHR